jgi:hypothetical protein
MSGTNTARASRSTHRVCRRGDDAGRVQGPHYLKPDQAAILRVLFGPDDESLAERSPISYAKADPPSMLFVDSTGDEPVCLDGFRRMRGVLAPRARFVELDGLGHNEAIIRVGMASDGLTPILADFVERTVPP